jgi:glycosyltransferase involved in cell wall biosynthesis
MTPGARGGDNARQGGADADLAVSVIIPVHNGERHLAPAVESVLAQTVPPLEILILDDGSTDGTAAVIRSFGDRVRGFAHPNAGSGFTRNRGLREARGALLAFLDGDDLWSPDKLEKQVAALRADDGLDLVFAHTRQFISPEVPAEVARTLSCDETPQPSTLISALLARRRVFDRVGSLDDTIRADFVDWYLRARDAGCRSLILPDVLVYRRIHPGSQTLLHKSVRREYLKVLKDSLDRRRTLGGAAPQSPPPEAGHPAPADHL